MNFELDFLDDLASRVLEVFGAPGLSIALLMNGEIVSRAYGVADVSSGEPVTPGTVFTVGSPTKGFTALAMAILRDEGLLDWDDSVSRFGGDLCPGAEEHAPPITIRDILTHTSGFGWHDPLWYNSPWSRACVIRKAWRAGPARPPRSRFQYCNVMYMLAGEIIARVSGLSYEDFVRSRILSPLGLETAHFSEPACGARTHACRTGTLAGARPPLAQPHTLINNLAHRIERPDLEKANAACGLRINARDLALWLSQFCEPASNRISRRALDSVVSPQVGISHDEGSRFYSLFGQPDWIEYGFGWFLRRYRGHRVVFHTGRLPGAGSHIAAMPDLGFGIVALTNLTFSCLAEVITLSVLERFAGGPRTDWISYYRDVSRELAGAANSPPGTAGESECDTDPAAWIGDYVDPAYGRIEVRMQPSGLGFAWANYRGSLRPLSGNKFSLVNLNCPLLSDGETLEFRAEGLGVLVFLDRRFERAGTKYVSVVNGGERHCICASPDASVYTPV